MVCAICGTRRPKRQCPGVRGEICTTCCGTEREVTVDCPLDCVYLHEAHQHERVEPLEPHQLPDADIQITEQFLADHETLVVYLARALGASALEQSGVIDNDVREALEALVRTYRSLESGVIYETRPANPLAARICEGLGAKVQDFAKMEQEQVGVTRTRDGDVMRTLVFLERLERDRNNGRPKGRAFLDFLRSEFGVGEPASSSTSSLIVP